MRGHGGRGGCDGRCALRGTGGPGGGCCAGATADLLPDSDDHCSPQACAGSQQWTLGYRATLQHAAGEAAGEPCADDDRCGDGRVGQGSGPNPVADSETSESELRNYGRLAAVPAAAATSPAACCEVAAAAAPQPLPCPAPAGRLLCQWSSASQSGCRSAVALGRRHRGQGQPRPYLLPPCPCPDHDLAAISVAGFVRTNAAMMMGGRAQLIFQVLPA